MNKKVCIVLSMFALVSVSLLCSPIPPPPPAPGAFLEGTTRNARQPMQEEAGLFDPEVDAVISTLVNTGSKVIGGYIDNASNRIHRTFDRKRTRDESRQAFQFPEGSQPSQSQSTQENESAVNKAMLNNFSQVGDDTVDLLLAHDKEDWKAFIDRQFQENPKALVETLIPLYQFHPEDVKELTEYIADKRDVLQVRSIVQHTADASDWVGAQQAIENIGASTSFVESPEAKAIAREFKGRFKDLAQKKVKKLEKEADKKAKEQWNRLRNNVWGN